MTFDLRPSFIIHRHLHHHSSFSSPPASSFLIIFSCGLSSPLLPHAFFWAALSSSSILKSMQLTNYFRFLPRCRKGICQWQGMWTLAISTCVCLERCWQASSSFMAKLVALTSTSFGRKWERWACANASQVLLIEIENESLPNHAHGISWKPCPKALVFIRVTCPLFDSMKAGLTSGKEFPFILKLAAQLCKGGVRRWPLDVSGFSRSRRAWRRSLLPLGMTHELQRPRQQPRTVSGSTDLPFFPSPGRGV